MPQIIFLILSNIFTSIAITLPFSLKLKEFDVRNHSLSDIPRFGKYKSFAITILVSTLFMILFLLSVRNVIFINTPKSFVFMILSLVGITIAAFIRFDKYKKIHSFFGSIYYICSILGMFMFAVEFVKFNSTIAYLTFFIAGATTFICQLIDRYFKGDYILEIVHAIAVMFWVWLVVIIK